MKISASIDLVWQLAAQEAIASMFKEIESDHFCMALLKFSELPVEDAERIAPDAEVAKMLSSEVAEVREELEARRVNSTRFRRELRAQIGEGDNPYNGTQMHRSAESRRLFDAAAELVDAAGEEMLTAMHLLQALLVTPTPTMEKILGDVLDQHEVKASRTPILDQYGKDLIRMASEGCLQEIVNRNPECKALLRALEQKGRKSVLLMSESDTDVRSVLEATAQKLAKGKVSAVLKTKRIVDVTSIASMANDPAFITGPWEQFLEDMDILLAEAVGANEVILFWPSIETPIEKNKDDREFGFISKLFKETLGKGKFQCVCRVDPLIYEKWIKKDPHWNKFTQIIWIRSENDREIPEEL